ncbi:sulfite exporter TauE/SafE family protein [Rothia nasisuis]|uniref:sulfite exporter TauE/SafE family protein n=1 Tax=Rothia nasisuis TaxID=2109647 RepID=UPI001F385F86|nr:sulfite exporter TauE/SafE family protein [Rothia nasisuis]
MTDLAPYAWAFLGAAAFLVGLSKTAVPGVSTVAVFLSASVLPARESTGFLLVMLMVGDVFALAIYRKHAHWPTLLRLLPAVLIGLVLGALFLYCASDAEVKKVLGVILLLLLAITLWQRRRPTPSGLTGQETSGADQRGAGRLRSLLYGAGAGFTTMVANAGGPMMSMYLLASRFNIKAFLGTSAWFFAVINLLKLPFSLSVGLVNSETLTLNFILVPLVVVGALAGQAAARRLPQEVFDQLVIGMTFVGAIYLLL